MGSSRIRGGFAGITGEVGGGDWWGAGLSETRI